TAKEAYLHGFFGTISAISNGGFDITGQSLIPFKNDYFVQFINMLLIIFGAIGFPVLIEVKELIFVAAEKLKHIRFSLFTKVTISVFLILTILGVLAIYVLEWGSFFADKS